MEEYHLLLTCDLQEDGYLEKLKKKAKECGVTVAPLSSSEVNLEGENRQITKLIIWITDTSRLEKVRYLKAEESPKNNPDTA